MLQFSKGPLLNCSRVKGDLAYPEEEKTEVDDEGQDEGQVLDVVEITGEETLHG